MTFTRIHTLEGLISKRPAHESGMVMSDEACKKTPQNMLHQIRMLLISQFFKRWGLLVKALKKVLCPTTTITF